MIYQDSLISISGDKIIFAHYYFPTGKSKEVLLADIAWITVEKATIRNGKWRIHGTGNLKTWFPCDARRPKRDRIFFAKLKSQWVEIGFTVENGEEVERHFKEKKLLKAE
ncbi:MAG: hypothetical protein PHO83_08435 [Geobacteraceae bacterium]|nr:hypothetical protein [Geobacteraceae bacterium]